MSSDDRRRLSDPRALRAMSHPVRLALIELLRETGPLTATEAGERIGESPANCSFHLRMLARYGFVEEAEGGRGRQRPWRASSLAATVDPDEDDTEGQIAAGALVEMLVERSYDRLRTWLATERSYPRPWREAGNSTHCQLFLTADELRRLVEEVAEVLGRYTGRDEPATRPAGSLPVSVLFAAFPLRAPGEPGAR